MKIEHIHQLFLQCHAASTDSRKTQKDDMFFALKGDNFNGNTYAEKAIKLGAKYAIVDEKEYVKSSQIILVDNVLETLQKLASFHRTFLKTTIISLTGSNGKTTTKELINAVLSKKYKTKATVGNLNNHIGVPLTLLSMTKDTEIGIVEMGANHQKEIEFLCNIAQPDYGYITNFGKAHLEGFGGIEGVIKGKSELYDYLETHDKIAFININDPIQVEKTKELQLYKFGPSNLASGVTIDFLKAKPFVQCSYDDTIIESQLIGDYNFTNISAAIAIGNFFKVDKMMIKNAIEAYSPSNNRSQILEKGNIKIILDAYNANPTSTSAALLNFEKQAGKKIAVLGDMFELGDEAKKEHQNIADLATSLNIDHVYFVGYNFYQSKINNESNTEKFKTFENFKSNFNVSKIENTTLLIKGSRGMALERVLELL